MDKVSWPAWYFGPKGERQIFEKAEDVPKGWQDDPNKFKKRKGEAPSKDGEKSEGGEDGEDGDDGNADLGGLTREQIIADLERRKVFFKASASDKALYRLLQKTIEEQS